MATYTLSPSDLTFTWDGCKRCFYLKVKHKLNFSGTFPAMFGKMGNLTSNYYHKKPVQEISPELPAGVVNLREKFVKSVAMCFDGTDSEVVIRGRFDAIATFEDGSYGIIDYKTSEASTEKTAFYSRQLSAYAYALEHPAPGALGLSPITRLGLFVVTPARFERINHGEMAFISGTRWMDVPRDDLAFFELLLEIVLVLDQPYAPEPGEGCGLCNYVIAYKEAGFQ